MSSLLIDEYLDRVLAYAGRDESAGAEIRNELLDHIEQKRQGHLENGAGESDAEYRALREMGDARKLGYSLRPAFPWVDIRSEGTARGVIAIGPRAVGIFAFGGASCGVIAAGGASAGLISFGGLTLGLLFGWGGMAVAGIAYAGMALGLVAVGGFAMGLVALGGFAAGLLVTQAGSGHSLYTLANAPDWLLALKELLAVVEGFQSLMPVFLPVFLLGTMGATMLMNKEQRRVEDDPIIQ